MAHGTCAGGKVEGDGGVDGDVGVLVVAEGIVLCHFRLGDAEDLKQGIEHFILVNKINKNKQILLIVFLFCLFCLFCLFFCFVCCCVVCLFCYLHVGQRRAF